MLTYDYGYQLQIRPVEGMRIDAMESANPEAYADISIYSPLDRNSLYPTESWEGRIYNMRTTDLSTVRTTKVVDVSRHSMALARSQFNVRFNGAPADAPVEQTKASTTVRNTVP